MPMKNVVKAESHKIFVGPWSCLSNYVISNVNSIQAAFSKVVCFSVTILSRVNALLGDQ